MGEPSQIALPLAARVPAGALRIVVGSANAAVIEALQAPTSWPFHVAVLVGPPRSGKTVLGHWAQSLHGAGQLDVIDDAETLDETALFHRWNAVQQGGSREGGALLMIANADPDHGGWRIALPDLASRIGGSLQLEVRAPDDEMAGELILAHAQQRGLILAEGASDYLVPRTTRSFAAIEALVAAIDRISLERQTPATMSVWRAALEALHGPEQQRLF
ncbi:chromosomal replication initiation ATPase DnaA [Erythromicrobium ramosum]|uniref:ATPase n=1 Tax=Erythrobacter ramosus TaxID=35811 RepID=A0A6I4UPZ9_9SPHN|nr:ATPase [Erythrobacter ramosus]MBB3775526.1 chromosomal replication initiation ATPase DnaA [Erythrobacter ramosus]MXP39375.1 ATPase [Erythrobacter ramosus]